MSATLGGAIVHFDAVPEDKRFRRRAELDYDQLPDNIRKAMHGTYRDCISDEELGLLETDEGFLDWCYHMNTVALRSMAEWFRALWSNTRRIGNSSRPCWISTGKGMFWKATSKDCTCDYGTSTFSFPVRLYAMNVFSHGGRICSTGSFCPIPHNT